MGVLPDGLIRQLALDPRTRMIEPFSERVADPGKLVSWGLQPAGYDARLDPGILVFDWARAQGEILDPLAINPELYEERVALPHFDIPPRGFIQGMTVEYFRIPRDVTVLGRGKTTYSSVGIEVNVASINPGWEGRLRIHIANVTPIPVRIRGGEGIVYLEFHRLAAACEVPYDQLPGTSFQGQRHFLVPPMTALRR